MNQAIAALGAWWNGLPSALAAGFILLLGWLAAILARFVLSKILAVLKFDFMSEKTGMSNFLRKGNVTYSPSKLVGAFCYWGVLLATFFAMSRRLDISVVNSLSDRFFEILPSIMAASFIAIIGMIVIGFVSNFVLTVARNASTPNARLLARAIKYAGNILVVSIALDQVGLGKTILSSMFQLVFGAVVFGVALAFGLGCKDLAREAMQRFLANLREKDRGSRGTDLEG